MTYIIEISFDNKYYSYTSKQLFTNEIKLYKYLIQKRRDHRFLPICNLKVNIMSNSKGCIVTTQDKKRGQTKNGDKEVKGKIPVYLETGEKILCHPKNLTVIGFVE